MSYNFNTIDGLFQPNYKVYKPSIEILESNSLDLEPKMATYNFQDINRIKSIISNTPQEELIVNIDTISHDSNENQTVSNKSQNSEQKWVNPYNSQNSKNKWIADMVAAYRNIKLNDNAIKNLIAKNALESGWGRYAQGDFNFGNITVDSSWKGRIVKGKDTDGKGNPIDQNFRAYNNLNEYVDDEVNFLKQNYDFNQNDDFDTFIKKLTGNNSSRKKYAVVKDYADRVRRVYNSIQWKK